MYLFFICIYLFILICLFTDVLELLTIGIITIIIIIVIIIIIIIITTTTILTLTLIRDID